MKLHLLVLSLALALAGSALGIHVSATASPSSSSSSTAVVASAEPAWGRIYLRRGLAPIQYFRDHYGGAMVTREVEFYFPRRTEDRLGCEPLPSAEQEVIHAANGSMALVVDRGVCSFEVKSRLAEQAGAAALVVVSENESARAPVAIVDPGDISIPSVMVRKSAGDMLRVVAARERVFGQLIPIVCDRNPYVCKGRTTEEVQYVETQFARSGMLVDRATNGTFGDFLAATFGSILPAGVVRLTAQFKPIEGCEQLNSSQLTGQVALFAKSSGCSALQQVSLAQEAGAVLALLTMGDNAATMAHPSAPEHWHAYNITIGAAAISTSTLAKLLTAQQEVEYVEIHLNLRNTIADAWDEIRRLSVKTAWPIRKDRKEKMLKRVVDLFVLDDGQLAELKYNFLTIAGGSRAAWKEVMPAQENEDELVESHESVEVVVDPTTV